MWREARVEVDREQDILLSLYGELLLQLPTSRKAAPVPFCPLANQAALPGTGIHLLLRLFLELVSDAGRGGQGSRCARGLVWGQVHGRAHRSVCSSGK